MPAKRRGPTDKDTRKTAGGFEYPAYRMGSGFERMSRASLREFRRLKRRLSAWLKDRGADGRARLSLTPDQVRILLHALREAEDAAALRSELGNLQNRDDALYGLYRKEGAGAVMRALRWSTGTRGPSYPRNAVVSQYLLLIGREPTHGLRLYALIDDHGRRVPFPDRVTPVEAVHSVTKQFGFPSPDACRKFLVRARAKRKKDNKLATSSGKFRLVDDFPIPDVTKL